jgi:arginase
MPTLLGIPYDGSSSFKRGPAEAPSAIRKALHSEASNSWSEAGLEVVRPDRLDDAGDLDLGAATDSATARSRIESETRRLVNAGRQLISLGGDHSITYPILRGVGGAQRGLTVLQIDAHGDLYSEFQGDRYSHACPFTRIMEEGLATRLVQVGVRTLNDEQRSNAKKFGVESIDMMAWADFARPQLSGPVYLSLDLDGLDPAFAPGVSHPEPGGLTTRDVIGLIQRLPGPIVGADVVELNPREDPTGITAIVAAKFVKEIAARMIQTADPSLRSG